jgi:DNA-binding NtrC family response regulator
MEKLLAHEWPGNIRELRNAIERAVLLGSGPVIEAHDVTLGHAAAAPAEKGRASLPLPQKGLNLEKVERDLVIQALERTGWNQTRAGGLLGMTRDQIHYRMEKYGLINPKTQ